MAFIKKPFRRLVEGPAAEADTYIDLGELAFEGEGGALGEPVEHLVKVAEVYRYEDVTDLTTHVYNGNILLIDFTSLSSDELALPLSRAAETELEHAVREERHVVRHARPDGILVRDDERRHAQGPEEMEEMEQVVPHVFEMGHRREHVERVDHDDGRLLLRMPSFEEVPKHAEPITDLLRALVLQAEPRDVDDEVLLRPQAQMPHRPEDRVAALLDGHLDPPPPRSTLPREDVEGEGGLHGPARAGDRDHGSARDPALDRCVQSANECGDPLVLGGGSRRRRGEGRHLLPQAGHLVSQLPELRPEFLGRLPGSP